MAFDSQKKKKKAISFFIVCLLSQIFWGQEKQVILFKVNGLVLLENAASDTSTQEKATCLQNWMIWMGSNSSLNTHSFPM